MNLTSATDADAPEHWNNSEASAWVSGFDTGASKALKAAERIAPWKFYDRIYGTHFPFEFKLVHED